MELYAEKDGNRNVSLDESDAVLDKPEPIEEKAVAKTTTDVPRRHRLNDGDSIDTVSENYGVPVDELVRRNERLLFNAAQARGLPSHTYHYEDPETGKRQTGYHVFSGEELEIRDPVEGERDYQR